MPEKTKEPKYKCDICGRPLLNPMTKVKHEKKCAREHNLNYPLEDKKITPQIETDGASDSVPKKNIKVKTPKKVTKDEVQEANELLKQYPVIADLRKDVEALKGLPTKIDGLYNGIDELKVYISNLTTRTQQNNTPPPETKEEITMPKNPQVSDALRATTNLMKKEKSMDDKGEASPPPNTSKIDELRKQTDVNQGDGKSQQVNIGTPNPVAGAPPDISGMPDWVQKAMAFGAVANQFLPLLQTLKGGTETQPAQTPDDIRMLERIYANMTNVFTGALKLTQGFRQEARKEIMDELKGNYEFIPRGSPPKETSGQGEVAGE